MSDTMNPLPSKEMFEAWLNAPATGPAVSTDNPYTDWQTQHLYEAWCAAWRARTASEPQPNASLSQMVDRFLAWPLPKSVCSDLCVTDSNYPSARSGTNLLTADEARSMLEYVTRAAPEPPAEPAAWCTSLEWGAYQSETVLKLTRHRQPEHSFTTPLYRAAQPPGAGPLKLDTDRQVFFYEQDHYYLSNFSAFMLQWNGYVYPTSEHAYQAQKFPDDPLKQTAIARASSAHDAFKMAERWKQYRRPDWDEIKVDVMRYILAAKADQHEYVRRKLLETGDRELIENSWRDDVWGWGPNRDGQNLLGKLWMEIRAELRSSALTKGEAP